MSAPACRELDAALARGVAFLHAGRSADGLWRDFHTRAGPGSDWVTGFVGQVLERVAADDPVATSAWNALVARQRRSGGWGYNGGVPPDCDSTAWVLLGLSRRASCDPAVTRRGVAFILRHQDHTSGGFSTYARADAIDSYIDAAGPDAVAGWTSDHVCVTAVALQALALASEPSCGEQVARGRQYLMRAQSPAGLWRSYWWRGRGYATCHALRALCHDPAPAQLDHALVAGSLASQQSPSGAWGDGERGAGPASAFETAFALLALASCVDAPAARASASHAAYRGLRWLVAAQQADGSWNSTPMLRIPPPSVRHPDRMRDWLLNGRGTGIVVGDGGRHFTSAAAVWALAEWRSRVGTT